MPTLFVVVPTFGKPPTRYNFAVQYAIVAELNAASLGTYTGAGGTEGFLAFGYRVTDELAARGALARAMEKHLPEVPYFVRVTESAGCNLAFEILKEFMPKRYTLRRADGHPFGNFEQVQALIRRLFPGVQFAWTASGPERIRLAQKQEGQLSLPPDHRQWLESLPSVLEGVAEGQGYRVTFGLGHQEPVACLFATPLGDSAELQNGLSALESDAGARFRMSEEDSRA